MDVRLSPEQQALRDAAAQVMSKLGPRAVVDLDDLERVAKLDAAVSTSGWRELRAADDAGAPWSSAVEAAIVAEELARGLADAPLLGPTLAADLRRLAGAAASVDRDGGAFTSRRAASAPTGSDGGRSAVAIDAHGRRPLLVLVHDGLLGLHAVARGRGRGDEGLDLTRPHRRAEPTRRPWRQGPAVWSGRVIGPTTSAGPRSGLAVACADLVGTMRGAIDLGCDYAKERRQYGAPIGSFQAVQHLLADAFVAMEGSRSTARYAGWAVDALPVADALGAAALAKAYCARSARTVCETAIQVHGGIGNTWECLAHVHLRRALLSSDVLGGSGANLQRVLDHHGIGDGHGLR